MKKIKMSTLIKTVEGATVSVKCAIEYELYSFMEFLAQQQFLCKSLLTKKVFAALNEECFYRERSYFSEEQWKILQKFGIFP